ncbi:hypothetical protein K0M31_007324 [Melipona bicolor]|uniref:Uncharacterized protein n=1 Tax=Melipona bicolor TaxID=60889 RepID=A0AA40GB68_9HYME|nr:hypothetical protein K0M31_007324 [Melipona bicolor]
MERKVRGNASEYMNPNTYTTALPHTWHPIIFQPTRNLEVAQASQKVLQTQGCAYACRNEILTWGDYLQLEFLLEENDWGKQLRDIEVKDIEFFSSCGKRSGVERVLKFPV